MGDLTCTINTQQYCENNFGKFHGVGTLCGKTYCGACYSCNGTCENGVPFEVCVATSRKFVRKQVCDHDCDPFGACCKNKPCTNGTEDEECCYPFTSIIMCILEGGTPLGICSTCQNDSCVHLEPTPEPVPTAPTIYGSCCGCNGTCIDNITEMECSFAFPYYVFRDDQTCDEIRCSDFGGCCLEHESCSIASAFSCVEFLGGVYLGACTNCSDCNTTTLQPTPEPPFPPAIPIPIFEPGSCCGCNGTCLDTLEIVCAITFPDGYIFTEAIQCEFLEPPCSAQGSCCFIDQPSLCNDTLRITEQECLFLGGDYIAPCNNCSACDEFAPTSSPTALPTFAPTPVQEVGSCCLCNGSCIEDVMEFTCDTFFGSVFNPNETCADSDCRVSGSCCVEHIICFPPISEDSCQQLGGVFLGICANCSDCNTTTLAPTPEPTPEPTSAPTTQAPTPGPTSEPTASPTPVMLGACCDCFMNCLEDVSEYECVHHDKGNWMGPNTTCGGMDSCGSCCNCTGECEDNISWLKCMENGGEECNKFTAKGDCLECDPFGACCIGDDVCSPQTTEDECYMYGGEYFGNCTNCDVCSTPAPSSEPTPAPSTEPTSAPTHEPTEPVPTASPTPNMMGACCYDNVTDDCDFLCTMTTRDICEEELWGKFWGEGSECGLDRCGACCECDGVCVDNTPFAYCDDNYPDSYFGKGKKCYEIDCQVHGACCAWGVCIPFHTEAECEAAYGVYIGDCVSCESGLCDFQPTSTPTSSPTSVPTQSAQEPTGAPTNAPTSVPTNTPTNAPTVAPTNAPTVAPTNAPTVAPTNAPTNMPTNAPTVAPTSAPTDIVTINVASNGVDTRAKTEIVCCLCNSDCVTTTTVTDCTSQGGVVAPSGLTCNDEGICSIRGACCASGDCTGIMTEYECDTVSGNIFAGACSTCDMCSAISTSTTLIDSPEVSKVGQKVTTIGVNIADPDSDDDAKKNGGEIEEEEEEEIEGDGDGIVGDGVTKSDTELSTPVEAVLAAESDTACCVAGSCQMTPTLSECAALGGKYIVGYSCSTVDCSTFNGSGSASNTGWIVAISVAGGGILLILLIGLLVYFVRGNKRAGKRRKKGKYQKYR